MGIRKYASLFATFLASTDLVKFCLKKIDSVFWMLESSSGYYFSQSGTSNCKERPLPWLIFWLTLFALYVFRVVVSIVLVIFDKKPIQSKDMVAYFRKQRRAIYEIGNNCKNRKGNNSIESNSTKNCHDVEDHEILQNQSMESEASFGSIDGNDEYAANMATTPYTLFDTRDRFKFPSGLTPV